MGMQKKIEEIFIK